MESRERPDRATEVAAQRRRRDGSGVSRRLKLHIPDDIREKLASQGLTPRWVNDTAENGGRIADLTIRDDYDRVEDVEPVRVGVADSGEPLFAYLLAKRNDFIEDDRAKVEQQRRETEAGMVRGKVPTGPGAEAQPLQGQLGAETYVVEGTKIGRANQVLD